MGEAPRRRLGLALRAAVSVGLVAALVYKVPFAEVSAALSAYPAWGLALGVLVMAVQLVVGAARWGRILARTGERVPLSALVSDMLVGSAYNMVLPSAVGGDVIKALRCSARLGAPHRAWSSTLFERMVGVPSLALVSVPGIAVVPGGSSLVVPTLVVSLASVLAVLFADAPFRWLSRMATRRSPAISAVSEGIAHDLSGPLGTASARAETFAWSLLYQLLGISILSACVLPLGNHALLAAIYAGVPLVALGSMLPVSIAGIGLRESLFVVIFERLGFDRATALSLGLLWLGSYIVLAVPGVVLAVLARGPGDGTRENTGRATAREIGKSPLS